ncbi:MAG: ABC transporter permease subunit [Halobacteriales archaeon]
MTDERGASRRGQREDEETDSTPRQRENEETDSTPRQQENAATGAGAATRTRVRAVLDREFAAAVRNRGLQVFALAYVVVVAGLALSGGTPSYLGVVLDLLAPAQLLVAVLAVGFGYGAAPSEAERAVIRTYPLSRTTYVLGAYVGRLVPVVAVALAPLFAAGVAAALTGGAESTFLASHAGTDSPLLLVRFAVLTAVYAAVVLAAVVGLSAVSARRRSAMALSAGLVVLVAVGLDLAAIGLLGGGVLPPAAMPVAVAASPASAFRGLVLATVGGGSDAGGIAPLNLVGHLAWLLGGLGVAVAAGWRS